MRNLLAFLAFAVLTFLGLGWYFGWYKIQKVPTVSGRTGYQIEIDSKKIKQDGTKFLERTSEELQEFLEHHKADDKDAKESPPAPEKKSAGQTSYGNDARKLIQGTPPRIIIQDEEEQERPWSPVARPH